MHGRAGGSPQAEQRPLQAVVVRLTGPVHPLSAVGLGAQPALRAPRPLGPPEPQAPPVVPQPPPALPLPGPPVVPLQAPLALPLPAPTARLAHRPALLLAHHTAGTPRPQVPLLWGRRALLGGGRQGRILPLTSYMHRTRGWASQVRVV